jgi:hypothetical protein
MPVKFLSDKNTDGTSLGQAAADLINLYGGTPASQRASSTQATSLLSTASSTAIDTLTKAALIEVMNVLNAIGAMKGSA